MPESHRLARNSNMTTSKTDRFGTAINCMDGRVQTPVIEFMTTEYGVDFVDMITEPGPIRALSSESEGSIVASIRRRVEISVEKHDSKLIAIVGHYDCAGNPVGKDAQLQQIRTAIKTVEAWKCSTRVVGLWVDNNWEAYEVG